MHSARAYLEMVQDNELVTTARIGVALNVVHFMYTLGDYK